MPRQGVLPLRVEDAAVCSGWLRRQKRTTIEQKQKYSYFFSCSSLCHLSASITNPTTQSSPIANILNKIVNILPPNCPIYGQ